MTPGNSNSDKPKTYPMKRPDGTTVRVTVPDDPKPEEMLIDAIRDNLSPQAVATIIAYLQPVSVDDARVQREVRWFSDQLTETLGGADHFNRLMEEVGL
jgi:hypothetical protein